MIMVVLSSWLGFHAEAARPPRGCGELLASERARLENAIAFALGEQGKSVTDPRLARLDRDLAGWAESALSALSPGRRENFVRVLETCRLATRLDREPEDEDLAMDDTAAQLVISKKGLLMVVEAYELQSEGARFSLGHELGHLLRFVVEGDTHDCAAEAHRLVVERPRGMLREEAHAARADYRYLRRNYGPADDERLRVRVLELPEMFEVAKRRGVLVDEGQGSLLLVAERLGEPEIQRLFLGIMRREGDARLLGFLREALTMSESTYVKTHVGRYREFQLEIDRERVIP